MTNTHALGEAFGDTEFYQEEVGLKINVLVVDCPPLLQLYNIDVHFSSVSNIPNAHCDRI